MKKTMLFGIIFLVGCSSTRPVEKISTQLDVKGQVGAETVGLNEDREVVIQEKQALDDKLRKLRWLNSDNEQILNNSHLQLVHCEQDIANPLLDGNGQMPEIPEVDAAMDTSKVKSTLGLDESGSLVHVSKELVQDRIDRENRYSNSLKSNMGVVKKHLAKCLFTMAIAREKHGLQSTWYFADPRKGHELETNLSIGFSNAAKSRSSQPNSNEK